MNTPNSSSVHRILLVEDNEHDVIAFRRSMKKSDITAEVTHVARAEEALERIQSDPAVFDVVVTDYKLPGMSGLSFCEAVIKRDVPLPVVLLTGAGSENLAAEALKAGAYDYIIKDHYQRYLDLLPVVLVEVIRKHSDRKARRSVEEALRDSEMKYRSLFEQANDSIFIINPSTRRFLDINENAARRLGYTKEELLQLTIDDIDSPVAARRNDEIYRKLSETGHVIFEHAHLHRDGVEIPVEISARVIDYGGHKVFQCIVRDITERRMSEDAIRRSEERFRQLAENIQEVFWIGSPDWKEVIYISPAYEKVWGRTCASLYKEPLSWFDAIVEADRPRVMSRINSAEAEEFSSLKFPEYRITRTDGSLRWILARAFPIRNERGEIYRIAGLARDITERKAAEAELEKRSHELGERVKELNCLYGISHLVEKHGHSMDKMLQGTVDLIPPSWQNPEITCARITAYHQEYKTENFRETPWQQISNIHVKGETIGYIEVFHLKEKPQRDEGPFIEEERSLIDAIASHIGRILERIQAEEQLKRESDINAALSELYQPLISPSASIEDIANTVLDKARNLTNSRHGYVSTIDPATGNNVSHTLGEMLKGQCKVAKDKGIVFPQGDDGRYGGLWGHSLNSLKPFFTNSSHNHRAASGLPEGHIPLRRFLSVPVMLGKELVGQIALANKTVDYTEQDLENIGRVADFYALAIQRSRARQALQKAKDNLEKRVEDRTKSLMLTNLQLKKEVEDRKLAEARLQHSKTMLQAVFDGIADPLILVDRQCRVKIINTVATRYYGVENPGDVVGNHCYQVFKGRLEPCDGCDVPQTVLEGQSVTFERKGFMDAERLEQVVIYPVKEKLGEVGDAIIRITDITEARKFERQLIQSEKMASLGVLVTSIAHEINNPNNFISFNIPILRDYIQAIMPIIDEHAAGQADFELCNMAYPEFRKDIDKLLDNIQHGSGRINSVVSNLREFSLDKDKKPQKRIDIEEIVERVLAICQNKIEKTVKRFNTVIPKNMPQIHTDPYALEQVLINLLVNAVQAADKRESRVELAIRIVNGENNHTVIEVSDNGSGMDEQTQLKIFDPFFTTKSPAEGTGLGLYVCHNLITDLGGRIEVKSKPGVGSTFKVILPHNEPGNMTEGPVD
jgi:PAS domain S-box-containing protein